MYADDTYIGLQTDDIHNLNEALNKDLEALDKWFKGNKLSLNVAKTQSMIITTKHKQVALEGQNEQLNLQIQSLPKVLGTPIQ